MTRITAAYSEMNRVFLRLFPVDSKNEVNMSCTVYYCYYWNTVSGNKRTVEYEDSVVPLRKRRLCRNPDQFSDVPYVLVHPSNQRRCGLGTVSSKEEAVLVKR